MSSKAEPPFRTLLRAEPMRRALALVAVFAVTLVLTLAVAFWFLRADAIATMDADNRQSLAVFTAAGNQADLKRILATEAAVAEPSERIFIFVDSDGRQTGNAAVALISDAPPAFASLPGGRRVGDGYRTLTAQIHGGTVVVARSTSAIMRLAETFLALVLLTVIPTTMIAIATAVAINARSSRRFVRMGEALERMTHGELSARVGSSETDELGQIEASIDRMAAAHQDAVTALRQVTADIAHELRTPLQRISVHLAEIGEETDDQRRSELVEKATDETRRSVDIFQALLQIAQIEGGSGVLRTSQFDVAKLVTDLTELYRPSAEDSGLTLTGPVPPSRIWMNGDEHLIGQAIANLIENALRHGDQGQTVACDIRRTGQGIEISVSDTGVGIPESERENVFDRLYRLERSRTTPGSGLGLSLVKAIVEAHRGSVRLEDNRPGLRCILRFPLDGDET